MSSSTQRRVNHLDPTYIPYSRPTTPPNDDDADFVEAEELIRNAISSSTKNVENNNANNNNNNEDELRFPTKHEDTSGPDESTTPTPPKNLSNENNNNNKNTSSLLSQQQQQQIDSSFPARPPPIIHPGSYVVNFGNTNIIAPAAPAAASKSPTPVKKKVMVIVGEENESRSPPISRQPSAVSSAGDVANHNNNNNNNSNNNSNAFGRFLSSLRTSPTANHPPSKSFPSPPQQLQQQQQPESPNNSNKKNKNNNNDDDDYNDDLHKNSPRDGKKTGDKSEEAFLSASGRRTTSYVPMNALEGGIAVSAEPVFHAATNPRTLIPWNQRVPGDRSAVNSFADSCGFCMAPHFWSRVESALRHTILAWLPILLILRKAEWRDTFFIAFNLPLMTVFVGGNTWGEFMAGFITLFKAVSVGIVASLPFTITTVAVDKSQPGVWVGYWLGYCVVIVILSHCTWMSWSSRFIVFLFAGFVADKWFFEGSIASVEYYGKYLRTLGIGVIMALGPCFVPWPRFAMKRAEKILPNMANSISILVQGVVASAWTPNHIEQRLDLVRLRQIRSHLRAEEKRMEGILGLSWYEPYSSFTLARAQKRFDLLKKISSQMASFVRLVDHIANSRHDILDPSSSFVRFGELLKDDLKVILEKLDSTLLRICDCTSYVTPDELHEFRQAEHTFMVALIRARSVVYYGENVAKYKFNDVDLYLAHFFFFLEEIFDRISKFEEVKEEDVPSRFLGIGAAILECFTRPFQRLIGLPWVWWSEEDMASLKHSIKLAFSMVISIFLQYPIGINTVAPGIVALAHFSDSSFQYALQYLLGTLLGGILSFISIRVADGSYALEVVFFESLVFFAQFVWTSENWIAAAIAIILSIASVSSDPSSTSTGLVNSLSTMVLAIVCHLLVNNFLLWPQDPIRMLRSCIDDTMTTFRDGVCTLLVRLQSRHMDVKASRNLFEATRGKLAGHLARQRDLLPAANAEPTLIGTKFPLPLYYSALHSQERMFDLYNNMCVAFERVHAPPDAPDGKKTLHWVVVEVVNPACHEFADLISGFIDLIRLLLEEGTATVPTAQLVTISDQMAKLAESVYKLRNDKINSIRAKKFKRVTAIREIQYSRSQSQINHPIASKESAEEERRKKNQLEALADAFMAAKDDVDALTKLDEEAAKKLEDEQADFESDSGSAEDEEEEDDSENAAAEHALGSTLVGSQATTSFPKVMSENSLRMNNNNNNNGFSSSATTAGGTNHTATTIAAAGVGTGGGSSPSSTTATTRKRGSSGKRIFVKGKKIDPMLGIDMDTVSAHALSTFIVATEGVSKVMGEFLESLLDIVNSDEIMKMTM